MEAKCTYWADGIHLPTERTRGKLGGIAAGGAEVYKKQCRCGATVERAEPLRESEVKGPCSDDLCRKQGCRGARSLRCSSQTGHSGGCPCSCHADVDAMFAGIEARSSTPTGVEPRPPSPGSETRPEVLRSLSPEELSKAPLLSEEAIEEAIERGRRDRLAAENALRGLFPAAPASEPPRESVAMCGKLLGYVQRTSVHCIEPRGHEGICGWGDDVAIAHAARPRDAEAASPQVAAQQPEFGARMWFDGKTYWAQVDGGPVVEVPATEVTAQQPGESARARVLELLGIAAASLPLNIGDEAIKRLAANEEQWAARLREAEERARLLDVRLAEMTEKRDIARNHAVEAESERDAALARELAALERVKEAEHELRVVERDRDHEAAARQKAEAERDQARVRGDGAEKALNATRWEVARLTSENDELRGLLGWAMRYRPCLDEGDQKRTFDVRRALTGGRT